MITNEVIKNLNPCQYRFDNYLKFYENKTHTARQFMGLKNITHEDKLWVALRLMPKQNIKLAAADIAESVLHIFEAEYPDDKRPRLAIKAARSGVNARGAYYAADIAADIAWWAAADCHAAYYAASSAAWAAEAAYYADAADSAKAAARDAANCFYYAGIDKLVQEKLIRKIILKYWR